MQVPVGREQELAVLERFLAENADESVLVLGGPAGIGKTVVWEVGLEGARAGGHRVLSSRAAQPEVQLSLSGLSDLLESEHELVLEGLPAPQRRALGVALLLEEGDEQPDRRALSLAFLAALRTLAADGPVLVAVDDAQWLDAGTAALLGFAARRLREEPVRFLLAYRAADDAALPLEWALPPSRLLRLELGPLSLGALGVVLRRILGAPLSRPLLRRIHETSDGNPFFALELARALERRGLASASQHELPVPQTLRSLVHERLEGLPDTVREALLAAAATPEPTQQLLDAVSDRPVDLRPALETGVAAWSGDRLRFTHPLLAASLLEDASPERLRALHARLADVVDDPEAGVRHRAAAAAGPDEEVAAALDIAAATARLRDVHTAAELAERALDLTAPADEPRRAQRASTAGWLHCEAGDGVRGGELMRLGIALLPPGPERAEAVLTLLRSAARIENPVGLGQEALLEAEDDLTRARLHFSLAEIQLVRGELAAGLGHAREAAWVLARLDDPRLHRDVLGRTANLEWLLGDGDPAATLDKAFELDAGLAGPDPTDTILSPRNILGRRLLWRDELDAARALFDELDAFALEHQAHAWRPNVLLHLVRLELRAGRFELAQQYAEETLEIGEASGLTQVLGAAFAMRALVEAHYGLVDEARRLVAESDRIGATVQDRWHSLYNRATLGFTEVSVGRYEAALDAVAGLAAEHDAIGIREPNAFLFERDAIEALVALDRLDEAAALVEWTEARGLLAERPRTLATAARGRALVLAAAGEVEPAFAEFDRAGALHERFVDPLDAARTLLLRGTVERRVRRRRDAREHLGAALERFDELGAAAFAARARDELERLAGRRTAEGLTPTEQRVAALAADGLTNRQIASSLVVTVSTVEAHLTRIYAKLGVRSRAQLARDLQA